MRRVNIKKFLFIYLIAPLLTSLQLQTAENGVVELSVIVIKKI